MNNIRLGRLYQLDALHSEPYSVLTHTPLSYFLDYGVHSAFPAFWSLRLVNIVLTVCCALLVANLSRLENHHRGIANGFAASLFLVSTPVFFWSQVARCADALACFFLCWL
jgi:4-amino-4-deoxy-L-arabinose transferase-like glycosyltransferase